MDIDRTSLFRKVSDSSATADFVDSVLQPVVLDKKTFQEQHGLVWLASDSAQDLKDGMVVQELDTVPAELLELFRNET
jgi:hypothetical protein